MQNEEVLLQKKEELENITIPAPNTTIPIQQLSNIPKEGYLFQIGGRIKMDGTKIS